MPCFSKNKEKLFSFYKLNKYFLMPFFVPIVCFSSKFFIEPILTDDSRLKIKDIDTDNSITFVYLYHILQSISLILGGLIYFISHCISKSRKKYRGFEEMYYLAVYNRNRNSSKANNKKYKKLLIIIFMPLLLFLYNSGFSYGLMRQQMEKKIYFIIFVSLFSILIFKKQIYRHQKFSLIICAIGAIPLILSFVIYLKRDEYKMIHDITLVIGSICISLYFVLIKYITLNLEMDAFLLLLYQSILYFAYCFIILDLFSWNLKGDLRYIYNLFHCNEKNYVCFSNHSSDIIFYTMLNAVLYILIFSVIYHFTPELLVISDIFSPLLSLIAQWIKIRERNAVKIIITVLGYLIMIFGALIYNELIICNFCGLNENTWQAIAKKASEEANERNDTADYLELNENYKLGTILSEDDE